MATSFHDPLTSVRHEAPILLRLDERDDDEIDRVVLRQFWDGSDTEEGRTDLRPVR